MATTAAEKPIKTIIVNGITSNEPKPDDNAAYFIMPGPYELFAF
ncbi:hypothetical protein [Nonomuraea glycinis]|nr:hypothetical protein OHA68_20900 [Nonomuraea glycinis]